MVKRQSFLAPNLSLFGVAASVDIVPLVIVPTRVGELKVIINRKEKLINISIPNAK